MELLGFIFGTFWGSFVGVIADRMNKPKSILYGRSKCDDCGKVLTWYELIPIFSYAFQGGKCAKCGAELSVKYPLIEVITGFLTFFMVLYFYQTGNGWNTFWLWLFLTILLAITLEDAQHKSFPSWISYLLLILGIFVGLSGMDFLGAFYGMLVGIGIPLILMLITRGKGMGDGDIWVGAAVGLALGWPYTIFVYLVAFIIGALFSCGLLLFKKYTGKTKVPFVPFLALGTLLVIFFGEAFLSLCQ